MAQLFEMVMPICKHGVCLSRQSGQDRVMLGFKKKLRVRFKANSFRGSSLANVTSRIMIWHRTALWCIVIGLTRSLS